MYVFLEMLIYTWEFTEIRCELYRNGSGMVLMKELAFLSRISKGHMLQHSSKSLGQSNVSDVLTTICNIRLSDTFSIFGPGWGGRGEV